MNQEATNTTLVCEKGFQTAAEFMANGDYKAALRLLLEEPFPDDAQQRLAAECHFQIGEDAQAADVVAQIEAKLPSDHVLMGKYLLHAQQWVAAEKALRFALSVDRSVPEGHFWLARTLMKGETYLFDRALLLEVCELLSAACRSPEAKPDAYLTLERLYSSGYEAKSDDSIFLLGNGLDKYPDNAEIRFRLVECLVFSLGDIAAARELISPLLLQKELQPNWIWAAYTIARSQGNLTEALRWIDELLLPDSDAENESRNTGLNQIRGELQLALNDLKGAFHSFHAEISVKPSVDLVLPLFGLAIVALRDGDSSKARENIELGVRSWADCFPEVLPGETDHVMGHYNQFDAIELLMRELAVSKYGPELSDLAAQIAYLSDRIDSDVISMARLLEVAETIEHPVVDLDLSCGYCKEGDWRNAVQHHLRFCSELSKRKLESHFHWIRPFYDFTGKPDVRESLSIHKTAVSALNDIRGCEPDFVSTFVLPFYRGFWRSILFEAGLWAEALDVTTYLHKAVTDDTALQFDFAYCLQSTDEKQQAIDAYRALLWSEPDEASALHNLSLLIEDEDFDEAIALSNRTLEISPDNELFQRRYTSLRQTLERRSEEQAAQDRERTRQLDFQKTARERFPQLDFHKRRILTAMTVITEFDDLDHLAELSGTGPQFMEGNWRRLVELGMVVEDESGKWIVNSHVLDLVQRERSHSVAITFIRADDRVAYKPVFNSKLEYVVYNVMIGLFPNHLVFPNMALQTIFQYDKIEEHVDADTFRYFLMSQVDLCITSTSSYLPIVGFEIDSHYHDSEAQKERDVKKNRLFQVGGVPLLRLRPHGQPNEAAIRKDIIDAVRNLGGQLRDVAHRSEGLVKLDFEVDFETFGNETQPTVQ
ncbi:MAG: DUF2726 domain-containing protein [Planctomycetaceae bacterium]|nr:DUF2726 domain-containing protein [Planctomycetaceae bacterium]